MEAVLAQRLAVVLAMATWIGGIAGGTPSVARADDFRILTRVYVGDGDEPASQTTTIFREGLVYDCVGEPEEVVIFDPVRGRFVLLDPERKLRAEITLQQIDALTPTMKEKLSRKDGVAAFLLGPKFEEISNPQTGETEFRSPWLSYRVRTKPAKNDEVARQYAAFSTHYTRLNMLKHPLLLARVHVNTWLNERKLLPEEVCLTTYKPGLLGRVTTDAQYRSQHKITWSMSSEDLRRIEQIQRWLVQFDQVRLLDYWEKKQPAEKQ